MTTITHTHRGHEFIAFAENFTSPNTITRNYPWSITGNLWVNDDESSREAERRIMEAAADRGASVCGDSESGQVFILAATEDDARIVIDVCIEQGRITEKNEATERLRKLRQIDDTMVSVTGHVAQGIMAARQALDDGIIALADLEQIEQAHALLAQVQRRTRDRFNEGVVV